MSDYIERKSIRNLYSCLDPEDKVRVEQVLIDIDAIPSADAVSREDYEVMQFCFEQMKSLADKLAHNARPQGEWQMDEDDDIYHCSKCFFEIDASGCIDPTEYISIYNFCPNCGSDNREREGE